MLSTEFTSTDEMAEMLAAKFPSEIMFARDYGSDKKTLSQALGPTLHGLKNRGLVDDDGEKWPNVKKWRRIEKKEGHTTIDAVVHALMLLGYGKNENQALRILAMRAIKDNPSDYETIVEEARKIEETKKKLLKTIVGRKETNG